MRNGMLHGFAVIALWALPAAAFDQEGGVAVFEAEGFATNLSPRGAHGWVDRQAIDGFSGTAYMAAEPDLGTNITANWSSTSPELQYPITLSIGGTHYVWVRAYAETDTGDSVHIGLNGTTNTAHGITLTGGQLGAWAWTDNRGALSRATVTAGAGAHTLNLWMREDGMRIDRLLLTTNAALLPILGNVWHIPGNPEPGAGIPSMRSPLEGMHANQAVTLYTGNQFAGGDGNPADQAQSSSRLYYRLTTEPDWTVVPLTFFQEAGNNKYYRAILPANTFTAGDTVLYYFRIGYTDRLPTYLYGDDTASLTSELESDAQANPFGFTLSAEAVPSGGFLSVSTPTAAGLVEARVYTNSGHLTLLGPDLNGAPLTNAVHFLPPPVRVSGESHLLGSVLSSTSLSNGLEFVQRLGPTTVVSRLTTPAEGVMRYAVIDWNGATVTRTGFAGLSDAAERVYGFGEKFNAFDQSGRRVHMLTRDVPGDKQDSSYKVAPWFMSTRGYGLHLDSTAESWFDMRAQHADRYVISNLHASLAVDLVYGPLLPDVLRRYTGLRGRPPLSPPWVFGPWMSSDIWRTGGEVRYLLDRYRALGIPGSVLVFDSPWEVGYNDFTWNMNQFDDAGTYDGTNWTGFATLNTMMDYLRTNGFKAVCWMTPFVNVNSVNDGVSGQNTGMSANYAEGAASNYFVRSAPGGPPLLVNWWKGTGSPIDVTHPGARQWLQDQLATLATHCGDVLGGFKTDDGESGSADGNVFIPTTAVYADGRTGIEMRNGFSVAYHQSVWDVLGTNGILFARSGFTGSQAYPACWAGDNEPNFGPNGMPGVIVAGQSAAMSGFSIWSHDVGGYVDSNWSSTPANLFMRWTQFGALSPIMQMHRQVGLGRQYPWSFGELALSNYVYYARLHTQLFPYRYTCAQESAATGMPILRPLVLLHQDDPNTYGLQHTYLLGSELLAAIIITNNATTRTVYLPEGHWRDFFTHQRHTGGQNILWSNADQTQFPLFVREGALIPMLPQEVDTLCDAAYLRGSTNVTTWSGALEFLIHPGTNSETTVYDGTWARCHSNATHLTIDVLSTARPLELRVLASAPFSVERDGITLPRFTNATEFALAPAGWRYEVPFVRVKTQHPAGAVRFTLGADSLGDGISDAWRDQHFGTPASTNALTCAACDADGDGMTNLDEFTAGTAPTNALSRLKILALENDARLLSWASVPGRRYRVAGSTNLASTFAPLGPVTTALDTITHYLDTNPATPARYYRVNTEP